MAKADTHDARIVEQFTRWARPFSEHPVHSEAEGMTILLKACDVSTDMQVLDVACGPGIVACALATRAGHVTGVDLTPAMIAEARRRQAREGLANLDWRTGDANALPFGDESFDVVVTRYSFHHLQRPAHVLAEMRRVCRPNGRVVVADATPSAETQAAYDRMETLRDPSHASALTREQLRTLGRDSGLVEIIVDGYRLAAALNSLADEQDVPALTRLFEADIASGRDDIGVGAWRADDGVHFSFPVSVIAWRRPA